MIVQENRTFNDFFATFPGVTGSLSGYELVNGKRKKINLTETPLAGQRSFNHSYGGFVSACDYNTSSGCQMDGFNLVIFPKNGRQEKTAPYEYVTPSDIGPYWSMAEQYALANAMFTTQGSASFSGHQALIRGGTFISSSESLIDNPPYGGAWGCDSGPGTATSLITTNLQFEQAAGPLPCTSSFPYYYGSNYETLRDLLDAKSISWKYYTPQLGGSGGIWDAFDVIAPVRYGPEWGTNVNWPETNVFKDISSGSLPAVSWVIPSGRNSDHPNNHSDTGPSWVASIVNAIGESQYWNSCAIILVWDDWGGFYDPVPPPFPHDNQGGPGFRVPMIAISPYIRFGSGSQGGYISNTVYGFGSIVRFIEDTYNLGRLGTTDSTSNSINDMFDFYQTPRQFHQIASKYKRSYFLHRKPSQLPVDTE
ncbi:MAG TPA: alkaline phosphatase family protein [Candidatus Nitrosotalea sp.]|nr:alkaline phosphatase family protein [Candidatus Nitrosotalea sp.]